MKQLYLEIGQRVADIRYANNLTQFQMAEILDISVKHCSCVERGESTFSLEKMVFFCDTFGVSLDYLVRGEQALNESAPIIPRMVTDIMSSDDENKKQLFLEYLSFFDTMTGTEEHSN